MCLIFIKCEVHRIRQRKNKSFYRNVGCHLSVHLMYHLSPGITLFTTSTFRMWVAGTGLLLSHHTQESCWYRIRNPGSCCSALRWQRFIIKDKQRQAQSVQQTSKDQQRQAKSQQVKREMVVTCSLPPVRCWARCGPLVWRRWPGAGSPPPPPPRSCGPRAPCSAGI